MSNVLQLEIDKDISIHPHMQRILLKSIKTRDDLDQLYCVIRASLADGNDIAVEVWENINQEEVDNVGASVHQLRKVPSYR